MTAEGDDVSLLNASTITALAAIVSIIAAAYFASLRLLHPRTSFKLRFFYIWHVADGLTHLILEASFLYQCFFVYTTLPASTPDWPHPAALSATTSNFLNHSDRLYGPSYGDNLFAKLWQEYAKADKRWSGADPTLISLELLTVFIGGPLALYVSELIRRGAGTSVGGADGKLWFWGSALAVAELYGGFVTFAPEWLTGSLNLDTSSLMKVWLYLVVFNIVWVVIPAWFLYEAYINITTTFAASASTAKHVKER